MNFSSLITASVTLGELYLKASLAPSDRFTGWSLDERSGQVIEELLPFYDWLYHYYFRVKTDGWENIPAEGQVLLIGSHNGGLAAPDMHMMIYDWFYRFGTKRLIYGLMDPRIWQCLPGLGQLAAQMGAIRAHPRMALAALNRGASLLIYPGGARDVFRPYDLKNTIYLNNNKAFIKLALRHKLPIIPLISCGAHSTLYVLTDIYPQMEQLHQLGLPWLLGIDPGTFPIYLGLPWGVSIGPLPNIPLPIQLHTRVCPPIWFDRYDKEASHDKDYVNECYNLVVEIMQKQLDQLVKEKGRNLSPLD